MAGTLAILQARTDSRRLPRKVLLPILGQPMILRQIERLKRAKRVDQLLVATSSSSSDDELADLLEKHGVPCFRGHLSDVLDRVYQAAKKYQPENVVRLTADCPLADPDIIDRLIDLFKEGRYDYASNVTAPSFPDGLDAEVCSFSVLETAWREASTSSDREHVTLFIRNHPEQFRQGCLASAEDLSRLRWTVDEPEDFSFVEAVYSRLYPGNPDFSTGDVLHLLEREPELGFINGGFLRNEGLERTFFADRYKNSNLLHARALETIPLASQTFSKSTTQFPLGVSPLFIKRGEGAQVWDLDDNVFLDFAGSLGAINLGYGDPDVKRAVAEQLEDGSIFPLPHPLEVLVAEKIRELVPCAEMVRFGKNGSDATTGAIRLARAHTKRDEVVVLGYHGWHDWYIGSTTRDLGVPLSVKALTHKLAYNDSEGLSELLKKRGSQIAALIMEPMNREYPRDGYLELVRKLCTEYGIVLIFDEMITGFRFANGGAQEMFGVTPDLATFGKAIANGFPLSALVGKKEIMQKMDEIFFSFTFGGETLSLAAGLATMKKLQEKPVIAHMRELGTILRTGVVECISHHSLEEVVGIVGDPVWTLLDFVATKDHSPFEIRTFFLQECFRRGILTIGSHFPSFAHSKKDVSTLLSAYDEIFALLQTALKEGNLSRYLQAEPLQPLFTVR